jgi:hypothetical protein
MTEESTEVLSSIKVVELLTDRVQAQPAQAFPRDPMAVDVPGMYAWWCDRAGLAVLEHAVGSKLSALIYVGQAGADSTVAGRRYRSTLGSRILGNHLRGNIRSSTFRKTLAACLALELAFEVDGKRLKSESNRRLSDWIGEHLSVSIAPIPDVAVLDEIETTVLRVLDPPLNLNKVPQTEVRRRISALRRNLLVVDV